MRYVLGPISWKRSLARFSSRFLDFLGQTSSARRARSSTHVLLWFVVLQVFGSFCRSFRRRLWIVIGKFSSRGCRGMFLFYGVFPLSSNRARPLTLKAEVMSEMTTGKVDSCEPKTPASVCCHFIAEACLKAALLL